MGGILSLKFSARHRQAHDEMIYPDIRILFVEVVSKSSKESTFRPDALLRAVEHG
jgi:hypothetical protein